MLTDCMHSLCVAEHGLGADLTLGCENKPCRQASSCGNHSNRRQAVRRLTWVMPTLSVCCAGLGLQGPGGVGGGGHRRRCRRSLHRTRLSAAPGTQHRQVCSCCPLLRRWLSESFQDKNTSGSHFEDAAVPSHAQAVIDAKLAGGRMPPVVPLTAPPVGTGGGSTLAGPASVSVVPAPVRAQ